MAKSSNPRLFCFQYCLLLFGLAVCPPYRLHVVDTHIHFGYILCTRTRLFCFVIVLDSFGFVWESTLNVYLATTKHERIAFRRRSILHTLQPAFNSYSRTHVRHCMKASHSYPIRWRAHCQESFGTQCVSSVSLCDQFSFSLRSNESQCLSRQGITNTFVPSTNINFSLSTIENIKKKNLFHRQFLSMHFLFVFSVIRVKVNGQLKKN